MEAPEKIYIHPDIGGREFLRPWLHRPANNESIEYVRKDAFVEKAVKHIDGLIEFLNEFGHQLKKERIIEDFKKYME